MGRPKTWAIVAINVALILGPMPLLAQMANTTAAGGPAVSLHQGGGGANSDAMLEIAPRAGGSQEGAASSPSVPRSDAGQLGNSIEPELPPLPISGPPESMLSSSRLPRRSLPYLGLTVQRIESHSKPGINIEGLEIVSVDHGSPAETAGLKGRTAMTDIGASAATAATLMAPLDIALMPLLKKTGQLGNSGDIIVAIDDRRVSSETDLQTALANTKPGDTIYLTVVRMEAADGRRTLKLPVKLGKPVAN
jgi:hypothetical protein